MWIIPTTHPLYSQLAPEDFLVLKEDLKELLDNLDGSAQELSLFWKSKQSLSRTWLNRWKKVYWLPHLFGRTLKPSTFKQFEEKWTSSLVDIPVNPSQLQDNAEEKMIPAISGRISDKAFRLPGQKSAFLKMSQDTSLLDTNKSKETYKDLVTRLKKEYSQRKKLALLIRENDSSSSRWPTPKCQNANSPIVHGQGGLDLQTAVQNWPTPTTHDNPQDPEKFKARQERLKARNNGKNGTKKTGNGAGPNLGTAVAQWPTAAARDYKDTPGMSKERDGRELGRIDQLPRAVYHYGQQDQEKTSTTTNRPVLNPAWVMLLMDTTIEKTFSEWRETALWQAQQR